MLEYDRIDISEGIDVNKTNLSKKCLSFNDVLTVLSMKSIFVIAVMI